MWPKMGNQTYVSRKDFWLKQVGHRYLREQIAAVTKRFKDERTHLLRFRAARAPAFHSKVCKLLHRAVRCRLARFKKCHVRYGKK